MLSGLSPGIPLRPISDIPRSLLSLTQLQLCGHILRLVCRLPLTPKLLLHPTLSLWSERVVPKVGLLYPRPLPWRQTVTFLMRPGRETLAHAETPTIIWFDLSPLACGLCIKPHLRHKSVTNGTFTVIFACPHSDDPQDPNRTDLLPNKTIVHMSNQTQTCLGHVLVVKHALPAASEAATILNHDLQLVDIVESDFAAVDEIVRIGVVHELWKKKSPPTVSPVAVPV
ncbi:hypothetical protein B0H14DRAFT_3522243 [Mycena olivaceomarginata]|nr:hypothetical protein B0H14DRAFT_3522243 [Mycena olivaceomarginata]